MYKNATGGYGPGLMEASDEVGTSVFFFVFEGLSKCLGGKVVYTWHLKASPNIRFSTKIYVVTSLAMFEGRCLRSTDPPPQEMTAAQKMASNSWTHSISAASPRVLRGLVLLGLVILGKPFVPYIFRPSVLG